MAEFRPKITSNEDDILVMQEQYLAGKVAKSSTQVVISSCKDGSDDKKKSLFAQQREKRESREQIPTDFEFPTVQVLKDVVENINVNQANIPHSRKNAPFPEVFKTQIVSAPNKQTSLFAQSMKKQQVKGSLPCSTLTENNEFYRGMTVLGKEEARKIHVENELKLASMNREDILEEQKKLLKQLPSNIVSFFKKRPSKVQNVGVSDAAVAVNEHKVLKTLCNELHERNTLVPNNESTCPPIAEEELPLSLSEIKKRKWMHMDVVEHEKLEWLRNVPPPEDLVSQPFQARFDFAGCLLPYNVDLPASSGLYHHGEEPGRAGYSISELLFLSRSNVLQQRVMALNILWRILEQNRQGAYDECFQEPLIPKLIESDFLIILRHSLDDTNESIVSRALEILCHLLNSNLDEICLERCYLWHRGEEQPQLNTNVAVDRDFKEEEALDKEMIGYDMVKACLRMNMLPRIRYILEMMKPPPHAVVAAVAILTRLARHSNAASQSIVECPRLLETLFNSFLPSDCSSFISGPPVSHLNNVYGVPLRYVFRLIRVIASWSYELANSLVSRFPLFQIIVTYIAMDTTEIKLPTEEVLLLVLDSYHTWRVFLHYGLGIEELLGFYPLLMRQILFYQNCISMDSFQSATNVRYSHQVGTAMLLMLEAALQCCCQDNCSLHYVHISGLRSPIETCLIKWMREIQNLSIIPESVLQLVAAGIQFLTTYFTFLKNTDEASQQIDHFCLKNIVPFLQLEGVKRTVSSIDKYSNLSSTCKVCSRDPDSLTQVNAVIRGGEVVPVLLPSTPFPFLTSILRMLRLWKKNECIEVLQIMKSCFYDSVVGYLTKISYSISPLRNNWFTRYEVHFLHQLLLFRVEWNIIVDSNLHEAALSTLTAVQVGDEYIAAQLLQQIIFNRTSVKLSNELETAFEGMCIVEPSVRSMLDRVLCNWERFSVYYVQHLFSEKIVENSEQRIYRYRHKLNSNLTINSNGQSAVTQDWIYYPILQSYHKYTSSLEPVGTDSVRPSLETVFVLLHLQPAWYFHIRPAEHYCRLACVFLAGSDLFLDVDISNHLWSILRCLCSTSTHPMDFSSPISGISDFLEFYDQLLEQFESVSYGNPLFGAFLLLPLMQNQRIQFRLKLWTEHPDVLRYFRLQLNQLPGAVENWLEPLETDFNLLQHYKAALQTGLITERQNPALWYIANYHVKKSELSHV